MQHNQSPIQNRPTQYNLFTPQNNQGQNRNWPQECLSTPTSKKRTSEKLEQQVLMSPVRKDSRKKAVINKALFRTINHCNILTFDEIINEKPELSKQVSNNDFEVQVQNLMELEPQINLINYKEILLKLISSLSMKINIKNFMLDAKLSQSLVISSRRFNQNFSFETQLLQLYNYIKRIGKTNEIEIDELENSIIVSSKLQVEIERGKEKQMIVSALFEGGSSLISQLRIQFA